MTAEVSPLCQYSDLVVTVRVTLQELSPKAAPNAVSAAIIMVIFTMGSPKILYFGGKRRARRKFIRATLSRIVLSLSLSVEMMILMICCLDIKFRFLIDVH